jgi:membrane-associated protein
MSYIRWFLDVFLHLDRHLAEWSQSMGPSLYGVLFVVVFCETGLIVTPFLPGDSLLFAAGSVCALEGSPLAVGPLMVLLIVAAVAGDAVNYAFGRKLGPKVFAREDSRLLNKRHLQRAQAFYEKHGGKAIILARFIPIVRTFAPFVAGVGQMQYRRFALFNVVGAVIWVTAFTLAGYKFASQPLIQKNFHYVIVAIIVLSVLPVVFEFWRERQRGAASVP